ncbi:MAG: biotin transporter BioY [Clostridia bacterium]|nr:biotin transporter BioY [Clostridia bacterium]
MRTHSHNIRTTVQCALFAALLSVSAWIQIPGAVPFTLQTMAICITAGVLGTAKGMASLLIYLGLGAIGLPVFSGFAGGIGALFGATGGFIFGFVLTVVVIGVGKRLFGRSKIALTLSMVLGVALCYAAGAVWFAAVYATRGEAMSLSAVLSACVLPFLLPEFAKIAAAVAITLRLWKIVEQ